MGSFGELQSSIPNYSGQFLYHIHLNPAKEFSVNLAENIEVASFLTTQNAVLNGTEFEAGEFVNFNRNAGEIQISNTSSTALDILLFGGEEYTEPMVSEGPFVMNSRAELVEAYRDFYAGKYGEINTINNLK